MAIRFSTAILVGGKSSRMGQDKALLQLNNERFIDRLTREFRPCGDVFLSVAKKGDYADLGLETVADEHDSIGPIEGIRQALLYAAEEYVFVCAADMPFLKKEMAYYLAEFVSSDYDAYVFCDEKRAHPLCAIYHKSLLPLIEELIAKGKYRLNGILAGARTKYVDLSYSCFDKNCVRNINTRDEFLSIGGPVVFCVSGIKNSGKTFLIEKLINEFIDRGLSVGVIKHDGHDFTCDIEGTDSERFYRAGADAVSIFSATQVFVHERRGPSIGELIERMRDKNVIIIEGLKDSSYPKVEIVRSAAGDHPVCDPKTLICIATDANIPFESTCPVFGMDDIDGIFCCILDRLVCH